MADTEINATVVQSGLDLAYIGTTHRGHGAVRAAWRGLGEAAQTTARILVLFSADIAAMMLAVIGVMFATHLAMGLGLEPARDLVGSDKLVAATPDLVFIGAGVLVYMLCCGRYRVRLPFWAETRQTCMVSLGALFATCLEQFALRGDASRQLLIGMWLIFPVCAAVMRLLAKMTLDRAGLWQINVLVVGDEQGAAYAQTTLETERLLGYRVVGVAPPAGIGAGFSQNRFRGLLAAHGAQHLILAIDFGGALGQSIVQAVVRERVPFSLIFRAHGVPVCGYESVSFFSHDTVLLSHRNNLHHPVSKLIKSLFDISIASLMLGLLALPMLIIAAIIRADGGPALFGHERVGTAGKTFFCLKFRTMVVGAERVLDELLARDPAARAEWDATQKLTADPRVTRIGRVLRATSLDELPQLLNILRQEMSLVGPRPIIRQELPRYGDDIAYYFETKPGLTGLWQVSGRSNTTYARRVEMDRWYVHNWTIWHDVAILLKTLPAVIGRHGAR